MRKAMLVVLALLVVTSGGLLACAQKATPTPVPTPASLQPPTLSLVGVFVDYPGANIPDGTVTALLKALTGWAGDPDKAKEAATVSTIEAPAVGMVLDTVFIISNPNAYPITVDSLDYTIKVNSEAVGSIVQGQVMAYKGLADDIYVPAKGQVTITGSNAVAFAALLGERSLQKGLAGPAAVADGLKVWEAVKKGQLAFAVPGTMQVLSQGGNAAVPFNFTFKP